jgi:cytochrome c
MNRRTKMYDGPKIITGLAVFVFIVLFPFLYTAAMGKGDHRPDPKLPAQEKECIESKEYMNAWHMDMLNTWRDSVVRDGNRVFTASDGEKHEMSLSLNCMKCHENKAQFCDQCHNYLGVSPYCWDCHVEPKGK